MEFPSITIKFEKIPLFLSLVAAFQLLEIDATPLFPISHREKSTGIVCRQKFIQY